MGKKRKGKKKEKKAGRRGEASPNGLPVGQGTNIQYIAHALSSLHSWEQTQKSLLAVQKKKEKRSVPMTHFFHTPP